jgi:hypothetical protein
MADEELEQLWDALHRAEAGDAVKFKALLAELLGDAPSEDESDTDAADRGELPGSDAAGS